MTIPTEEERLAMRKYLKPPVAVMRARLAGSLLQRALNIAHDKYEIDPDDERNSHIVLYGEIAEKLSNDEWTNNPDIADGLLNRVRQQDIPSNLGDNVGYKLFHIMDKAVAVSNYSYDDSENKNKMINLIADVHGFISEHTYRYAQRDTHAQVTECIFNLGYEGMLT